MAHLTTAIHIADTHEPGYFRFNDVLDMGGAAERARLVELAERLQPDDPINIQFTSGTTGAPKAATLSHHNIVNNAFFTGERMGVAPGDRYCTPLPLYHCGGMVCGSLVGVVRGATMIYPGEGFDPLATLEASQRERCTVLAGVPTMFVAQLNHPAFGRYRFVGVARGHDRRRALSDGGHETDYQRHVFA